MKFPVDVKKNFEIFFFAYCLLSIFLNFILFVFKVFYGKVFGIHSLVADGVHSLSDGLSSLGILIGRYSSQKPPDKKHPFGHGQVEWVTLLGVSILLIFAGYEILKDSIHSFFDPQKIPLNAPVFFLIFLTIVLKEIFAQLALFLYKKSNSEVLKVDAYHHRADLWSSFAVLFSVLGSFYGILSIDSIVGFLIGAWIVKIGFSQAQGAIHPLIGTAPTQEELDAVIRIALSHPDVFRVHDIIYHKYGKNCLLSLHIEISEKLSFMSVHEITEEIEQNIEESLSASVVIHTDPVNFEHPLYDSTCRVLKELQQSDPRIETFYALRIVEHSVQKTEAVFGMSLVKGEEKNKAMIKKEWIETLEKRLSFMSFKIHIASYWAYTPPNRELFFNDDSKSQ